LFGSLFVFALLAAPALAAPLVINSVKVVVGTPPFNATPGGPNPNGPNGFGSLTYVTFCNVGNADLTGPACDVFVWNLGGGVSLNHVTQDTLILAQTGAASNGSGGNFDTSERGNLGLVCGTTTSTVNVSAPCNVQIYINDALAENDTSGNNNPLTFGNDEDLNPPSAELIEAHIWVTAPGLTGAPAGANPSYSLQVGYADNAHTGACATEGLGFPGTMGGPNNSCFPQRVWCESGLGTGKTSNCPSAATVFIGDGFATLGACPSTTNGNQDSASPPNTVGCWDSGALLITALPQTHLTVLKQPKAGMFTLGGGVSYSIQITNDGDAGSVATGVALTDQLPTNGGLNWSGATITATQGQATCSISSSSLLTCTNLGSLNSGSSVTVTVSLLSTPLAACQDQPNPLATATDLQGDSATDSGDVSCTPPPAQLKVVKTPKSGTFAQGGQTSFTIVVSNPAVAGSKAATNVVLTDQLPSAGGLVWTTATTGQGTCTIGQSPDPANFLRCNLGTIQPQGSVTITVSSDATTPASACQLQNNPDAHAAADGPLSADDSGSLNCTPPQQGGLIAPTGTTCQQFASGTASALGQVNYSVSGGKIGQNINPGVFFYYAKITVPANTTVTVGESQNDTAALFQIQQNQAYLFTADCTKSLTGTQNAAATGASFTVAIAGTYIVSVKYQTKTIAGTAAPTSDPVTYTFTTTPPGASSSGSVLLKKQ
jgi:uncharacterized repeat protein (TIGR01451 family)